MEIKYYYRKPDDTLGQLIDEKEGCTYRINDSIEFIKVDFNTQRAFGLIQGGLND